MVTLRKLQKQVQKGFDVEDLQAVVTEVAAWRSSQAGEVPEAVRKACEVVAALPEFLARIEKSYNEYEEHVRMAVRNLEISSGELSQSNLRLRNLNDAINSMIDSLGEGYFVCNADGVCEGIYSRICETIFGHAPTSHHLFDLLNVGSEEDRLDLADWLKLAFMDSISEDDLAQFGPSSFKSKLGKYYGLRFRALRSAGKMIGLVAIATDNTREVEADHRAEKNLREAQMIKKLIEDREQFLSFLKTAGEMLDWLEKLNGAPSDLSQARFDLHTLKGAASSFYLTELEDHIHACELKIIDAQKSGTVRPGEIRLMAREIRTRLEDVINRNKRLLGDGDDWINTVSVSRKTLVSSVVDFVRIGLPSMQAEAFLKETIGVDMKRACESYRSTVQVAANRLNKQLQPLVIEGDDLRFPFDHYRRFFGSLVHVFRNAVDHGIEFSADRVLAGKDPRGQIRVQVLRGSEVNGVTWAKLIIEDDGRGIDVRKLRERVAAKQSHLDVASWSDQQVLNSIFDAQVSMASQITELSGMGVGLAAVGAALKEIEGRWNVETSLGHWTRFTFEVPLKTWMDVIREAPASAA